MADSCLGGELPGGKAGPGSQNKIPLVAAVSLNEAGNPIHARINQFTGFRSEAIGACSSRYLAPDCVALSSDLACFRAVTCSARIRSAGAYVIDTGPSPQRTAAERLSSPVASSPTTYRSWAGSTACWAPSRAA